MKIREVLNPLSLAALLGGAALYYAREVEPWRVEVTRVSLALPRLDPQFDGYRVVQIGDVHADGRMTPGRLLRLVHRVNAEEPDLIAVMGDLATYSRLRSLIHHVPKLAAPLRRFRARDGVLAVLGNHDHKTGASVVRRVLEESGIVELQNTVRTLRRNGASLHLAGIDSAVERMARLDRVLENLPRGSAAVLLAHEPDLADASAATGRFDLQLSGHSHGGQVRLPGLGPQPFLPPLSRRYPDGLYRVGGMLLYTNRGLGSHPRLRFNCRPEITVLTLRAG